MGSNYGLFEGYGLITQKSCVEHRVINLAKCVVSFYTVYYCLKKSLLYYWLVSIAMSVW